MIFYAWTMSLQKTMMPWWNHWSAKSPLVHLMTSDSLEGPKYPSFAVLDTIPNNRWPGEPMICWWANRRILTFNIDEKRHPDSWSLTINSSCLLCFPYFSLMVVLKSSFLQCSFTLSNNEWEEYLTWLLYSICILFRLMEVSKLTFQKFHQSLFPLKRCHRENINNGIRKGWDNASPLFQPCNINYSSN